MANINDYLIWRGDIPISKKYPFNELDSMVLARFSYLPFHRIKMKRKETIYSIYNRMKYFPDKELMYSPFQCMAQYFLSLGYEGIVYSSTVFPEGKNVVLFDKEAAIPFGKIRTLTI